MVQLQCRHKYVVGPQGVRAGGVDEVSKAAAGKIAFFYQMTKPSIRFETGNQASEVLDQLSIKSLGLI